MKYEGLLPIGTIVELANSTKKMMIGGYYPTGPARPGYVWDYSGFPFPEGYMDANQIFEFDANQITKVIAMGYQDEEQFAFKEKIDAMGDQVKAAYQEKKEKTEE